MKTPHFFRRNFWLITFAFFGLSPTLLAQLANNGGFEESPTGTVTGRDVPGWVIETASGLPTPPLFDIVDDSVQSGSRALRVTVASVGGNDWDIQAIADSIPVTPGRTYRYTIWARADHEGAQVNFTIGNYAFSEYGAIRPANLSTAWQKFTFDFTISDQETVIRAPVHLSRSTSANSIFYLDNFSVVDVALEAASRFPIIIEADSGALGNDFAIMEDGGTRFIAIQSDGADFNPPVWDYPGFTARIASYQVSFPMGAVYNLFARVRVGPATFDDDSFFYAADFGMPDSADAAAWVNANQLAAAGFTNADDVVLEPGAAGEGVWKWINLSRNAYQDSAVAFAVGDDSLTRTFRIGGRETGLEIDRLAFGRADLYFTVGNLDNGEPGSEDPPGGGTEQDPLATGHSKWLGCAYSAAQAPQFENYWNQVTPENAGKWGSVEPSRDAMNWGGMDQAYNFAKNNGFPIRYHVLIWGNQQPSWIENLSETEQLAEIEEFFQAVANRYPDIDYLEVVNEPLHDPPDGRGNGNYINALGGYNNLYGTGHDWIIRAFELARQYFPDSTKLMINDYSIINDNNATTQYLNIINSLVSRDLIDGIGVQGHAFSTRGSVNTMVSNLTRLGNSGLPIQICEMDIDGQTDTVQLTDYQRLFPPLWEHPAVEGITLWGWRPGLWRNDQRAFLIDENGDERPALVWLRDYLRSTVGIGDPLPAAPGQFRLHQNFPNPFNPETRITYDIAHPARVTLIVYDILGRQVATLVDRHQGAGRYTVPFRAGHLASGIYFYRLHTGSFSDTQKMMLVR